MMQVEEMRAEYAKQMEKEEQLVKLEDETASDWDLHSEFCPHKVAMRQLQTGICILSSVHIR
jgi:hypothetical protein